MQSIRESTLFWRCNMKRILRRTPIVIAGAMAGLAALVALRCAPLNTSYKDPWHARIEAADIVEKNVDIGPVSLSYAEGPNNGPALLLLHA
jgi:hypothetical protein